jgi:outer membrane protein OmpA-like peptidoglycan-associated protein
MRSIAYSLVLFFVAHLVVYPVKAQSHYDTLVLHFAFNSAELRPSETDRLIHFLHTPVMDTLFIIGYTDTTGTVTYNNRLSRLRAKMTARYIQGLTPSRLSVSAKGKLDPIPGDDSLSRRVLVIAPVKEVGRQRDAAIAADRHPVAASNPHSDTISDLHPDTVISLSDINFDEDTPNLTAASRLMLPGYIQRLRRYKGDSLEVDGYCNSLTPITSTKDPLFQLSIKRAKLIYDFLIEDGFDPARLSYKGMGNTSPRNPHPVTSEEARANMRVEIRIFRK